MQYDRKEREVGGRGDYNPNIVASPVVVKLPICPPEEERHNKKNEKDQNCLRLRKSLGRCIKTTFCVWKKIIL